jgi:eukaryotic-like serine/threonine-protein kinase
MPAHPESNRCSQCGTSLPEDAPGGLCVRCLLQLGLGLPWPPVSEKDAGAPDGDSEVQAEAARLTGSPIEPSLQAPNSLRTTAADTLPVEEPGNNIGRYKLLQQIGEGGCGVVYMAEQDQPIRRRVALKVIKLGMDTRQVIARFEAERQALALMDHPNIAKVLDAGATETGRPFFVMELVAGEKITDYCDRRNLAMSRRLALFVQVCRAVQHAHQKGVIHRDLKPSNILVTEQEGMAVPKIIDFGIAKATGEQRLTDKTLFTAFEQFIGTPAYMSPEQAGLGRLDIDTRSDIYSLGVLLYELLTGQPPFNGGELQRAALDQILRTIREKEPRRPSTRLTGLTQQKLTVVAHCRQTEPLKLIHLIRGDLDWIVMKCLEKDRTRRYETANGLARDIERHINCQPVIARPAGAAYRFQKLIRRHRLLFFAVSAVAVTLVLGIAASTLEAMRARRAEQQQSRLRSEADTARQQAEAAARRAEAAGTDARTTLAAFNFLEASRLIEANHGPDAVAYLSHILTADPEHSAALSRLATLITYRSWWIPALSLKHEGWVCSAQFSPDGKHVVTASNDHTARVWDAQTGQPLTEPLKHGDLVMSAQFSPDGKRVLTASWDNTARVWDAHTGQPLTEPLKHEDHVSSAQFSPDGRRIVSASFDNTARAWDAQTGQPLTEPLKHAKAVKYAQFSPDGRRVVTASWDNTARVWNAHTGQPMTEPLKHADRVVSAQFSPDGQRVVTASDDFTARVWDAETGQPLTEPLKHLNQVVFAQFSPEGKRVVTASRDKTAQVWDAQTGRRLTGPLQHSRAVGSAQFSPDGQRIITASADYTARVWDAQTGQPLVEPLQHPGAIWSAQFSPDGQRIITASADNTARVWDAQTGPPLNEPFKHGAWVHDAQFSPDGRRIVTASYDHTARLWDAQTGQPLTEPLKHAGLVNSAQFSPDGRLIVTASYDHTARVWDAQTGQPVTEPLPHGERVNRSEEHTSELQSPDRLM